MSEKFIIINKSTEEKWYHELENKMIPFFHKDKKNFYVRVKTEVLPISIEDASELKQVELELDDETLDKIDKTAREMGLNRDELINLMLKNFKKEREGK